MGAAFSYLAVPDRDRRDMNELLRSMRGFGRTRYAQPRPNPPDAPNPNPPRP